MNKSVEKSIEDILNLQAAAGWRARLTAAFFDPEARLLVVDEIHRQVAATAADSGTGEREALQQGVIRRLLVIASRDAGPPARDAVAPASPPGGPELEDRVIRTYPYPIAT